MRLLARVLVGVLVVAGCGSSTDEGSQPISLDTAAATDASDEATQGLGDIISVVTPVGEFVVAEDGTISGSFVYTTVQGVDEARLTSMWDRTLVEAQLSLLDDGLTFTAPMDLVITWNDSDQQPYVENVTGILDVDIGQLVVTGFTKLDSVRFAR